MPQGERGRTDAGFREQLLARLRNQAREHGVSAQRLQQRVAFERFLARLGESGDWILKGGFALELRYGWGNRPTIDINLRTLLERREALARLRVIIAQFGSADSFAFELSEGGREMQGAPGGTTRVRVVARLAGVPFTTFHVDLSSGDVMVGEPPVFQGSDLLAFAGIEPVRFPVYPVAQHLAEKLHAYTLPREVANTRVKDLVDLVTLAMQEIVDGDVMTASLHATFDTRGTHAVPGTLPQPLSAWSAPYRTLVSESPSIVSNATLHEGYMLAVAFWNPVLVGAVAEMRWTPAERMWQALETRGP